MSSARPGTAGATRVCPHCKATILESASVCPACRGHLRYDEAALQREKTRISPLTVEGLAPGAHAIHLHTSGNCDAKSGFTAAGPILTLTPGRQHGYLAEGGPLAGDLPNQFAGADGRLHASTVTNGFSLGNGKRSIFDRDGVSVIVDARGDDYRTQPLGNAGNRIACGVVIRTRGPAAWKMPAKPAPKPAG